MTPQETGMLFDRIERQNPNLLDAVLSSYPAV
jgi:hypothetical protein